MPRVRTIVLATLLTLLSFGLGAGLAWRWLLRETLLVRAGRTPRLADVLRPRGTEHRAFFWGIAFLPIVWGGALTFLSPLVFEPFDLSRWEASQAWALLLPWLATAALGGYLRLLYRRAGVPAGEAEPEDDRPTDGNGEAWSRHLKVALWCGLPGLGLCSLALVTEGALAPLAIFTVPVAFVAPCVGALAALPTYAKGLRLPSREDPPLPWSWWRRTAAGVTAMGLVLLWLQVAQGLFPSPRRSPLLEWGDFSRSVCMPAYWEGRSDDVVFSDSEAARTRLVHAGEACAPSDAAGEVQIDQQILAWCVAAGPAPVTARFVALDARTGGLVANRSITLASTDVLATRQGAVVLPARGSEVATPEWGDDIETPRVVRIGRNVSVEKSWAVPETGRRGSVTLVSSDVPGRVLVSWERQPDRIEIIQLGPDLLPLGRPAVVRARGMHVESATSGEKTCVDLWGPGGLTLVLDRQGRIWRPGLTDRLAARAGTTFHLTWTGLVLAIIACVVVRAGVRRRRFSRSVELGSVLEGTLEMASGEDSATLRRADGQIVLVRTAGARREGLADGEPLEGPCVIVGATSEVSGPAYRSAPTEVDAAKGWGIVRGDLSRARTWVATHTSRVVATGALVGWLLVAPVLLLLLVD